MLAAIRTFAKSWVAAVLIGLLIVSFAVFGIRDVFTGKVGDVVIKAGSRVVSSADFRREFDNYKGQLERQAGQPIPVDFAVQNGLDRQVLDGVATREAFSETMARDGIRPSDKLVAAEIGKEPAFFDQVSGRFDKKVYAQKLGEIGLTPTKFDQVMRDQLAQKQWETALVNGLRVPRAYGALGAIYAQESRDVAYFRLAPQSVAQPAAPTDAQLTAFMQENAAQLTRPEFRVLTVVRFSPAAMPPSTTPIDEAALKKRYDFRKDTISSPETRTVVQIPAKDGPTAQRIGQALAAGQPPAAVAKAAGVDAIVYADKPQSAISDHKIAQAAFAMTQGQIQAVRGDLGPAIVQVTAIKAGHAVTYEQARPQLEAELRKDAAAEKVYALTQVYDDAHQGGASLADSARKAGVPVMTIGPVTKTGQDQLAKPVPGLDAKLLETAFGLPAGGESELEDIGGGEYYAVKVEKVLPPAMPPLADIRPLLTQVWMQRELGKRLVARADELVARVRKGEKLDAVAASVGVQVVRSSGLSRQAAAQNTQLSQDLMGKALAANAGDVFAAEDIQPGLVVAQVEGTHPGDIAALARGTEQARPQISMAIFRELDETSRKAARARLKVTMDTVKARAALGLDPAAAPGEDAAPGKAGPAKPGLAK